MCWSPTGDYVLSCASSAAGQFRRVAGAEFEAVCTALVRTPSTPSDAWRTLPIRVTVTLQGYEKLEFEHRLQQPLPPRVLKPKTG